MTEQYILQRLKSVDQLPIYYWTAEKAITEVDFIIQYQNHIIPFEVKAAENLKTKSLKAYHQKYNPEISIRTSLCLTTEKTTGWLIYHCMLP